MGFGIAGAVECKFGTLEERTNTSRIVVRLWVEVGFLLDSKTHSVDDGELPAWGNIILRGFMNGCHIFSSIC